MSNENLLNDQILPRLIRIRDAPQYLGMKRQMFELLVRPQLQEIHIGKRGIAFDRIDLDRWVDHYRDCSAHPPKRGRINAWVERKRQACVSVEKFGTCKSTSLDSEFQAALELTRSKKLRNI